MFDILGDAIEYAIDENTGPLTAETLRQLDRLIDDNRPRHITFEQFRSSEPKHVAIHSCHSIQAPRTTCSTDLLVDGVPATHDLLHQFVGEGLPLQSPRCLPPKIGDRELDDVVRHSFRFLRIEREQDLKRRLTAIATSSHGNVNRAA